MEDVKDIHGYRGLYMINKDGGVYSYHRNKYLSPAIESAGYLCVTLSKYGKSKTHRIHRLVAETFIENNECLNEVNHIDGNKLNNNVSNLEWCTRSKNVKHSYDNGMTPKDKYSYRRLTKEDVIEIRASGMKIKELAEKYNTSESNISHIINRKSWRKI